MQAKRFKMGGTSCSNQSIEKYLHNNEYHSRRKETTWEPWKQIDGIKKDAAEHASNWEARIQDSQMWRSLVRAVNYKVFKLKQLEVE